MVSSPQQKLIWVLVVAAPPFAALGSFLATEVFLLYWMENAALSHGTAAWFFGGYGLIGSVFGIAVSPMVDALDKAQLTIAGTVAHAFLTLLLAGAAAAGLEAVAAGLFLVQLGAGILGAQAFLLLLQERIRTAALLDTARIDEETTRLFGVQYAAMNVGALAAGTIYDALRQRQLLPLPEANVLALGAAAAAALGGAAIMVPLVGELVRPSLAAAAAAASNSQGPGSRWPLWREPTLWRFALVCVLLVATRTVMRHLDMTLPIVMLRTDGDKARFALLQAVNPALIIVLGPLVQWATAALNGYWVITAGTAVTALSLLAVAFPPKQPTFAHYLVFIAIYSVGEALWSMRFGPYAMRIAPKGRQATYLSLGAVPSLVAKLPSSFLSSWLVEHYCSARAPCDAAHLWRAVFGMALVAPIGLALFRWQLDPDPVPRMRAQLLAV